MENLENKKELCWICREQKPINQIDMTQGNYTSGVCLSCQKEQTEKIEASGAKIIHKQEPGVFSGWHSKIVTYCYVAVQANGKIFTMPRRYTTIDYPYETHELFSLVNKFIKSNYQSLLYYGDLELLKEKDFWWYIAKNGDFYKINGNCFEYSNAFWLETLDLDQLLNLIEVYTPLPEGLRNHVKEQINKGLVLASNPKAFEREKILCFQDYTDYKKNREPKTIIIKNYQPLEVVA
jgi:hypothetical protein